VLALLAAPAASDTPTWTDVVEARSAIATTVITALAAIATIWLLVHQIRETERARTDADRERAAAAEDRKLARDERADQQAAQARTVVASDYSVERRPGESDLLVKATIWNYSPEPILNVTVVLENELSEAWKLWFGPLIAPGGSEVISLRLRPTGAVEALKDARPCVYFTDSSGRRWSRASGCKPYRDSPPRPVWSYPDVHELENPRQLIGS
jgi:hypothetical protein